MIVLSKFSEGLENRQGRKSLQGSNPCPFAKAFEYTSFCGNGGSSSQTNDTGTNGAQSPTESTQKGPHRNRQVPALSSAEEARFWAMVERGPVDKCWHWKGATNAKGYGRFKIRSVLFSPHRVAYRLAYGEIVDTGDYHGSVVIHRCDNPRCCNPAHLVLGTQRENVADMDAKSRGNRTGKARVFSPTPEQLEEILTSPLSGYALAAKYGAHRHWINRIRREHGIDTHEYRVGHMNEVVP